jgi:hypothetical protein
LRNDGSAIANNGYEYRRARNSIPDRPTLPFELWPMRECQKSFLRCCHNRIKYANKLNGITLDGESSGVRISGIRKRDRALWCIRTVPISEPTFNIPLTAKQADTIVNMLLDLNAIRPAIETGALSGIFRAAEYHFDDVANLPELIDEAAGLVKA